MTMPVLRIKYFHLTVPDEQGEGYRILSHIAQGGVNLLAFHSVPLGPDRTRMTVFPEQPRQLRKVLQDAGIEADGPHEAILIRGEDRLGVLADLHQRLGDADVHVFASVGVSGSSGEYACVLYVRPEEIDKAAETLGC